MCCKWWICPPSLCVIQITGACKFRAGPGDSEAAKACELHSWMQPSDPQTFTCQTRVTWEFWCPSAGLDVISVFACTVQPGELNGRASATSWISAAERKVIHPLPWIITLKQGNVLPHLPQQQETWCPNTLGAPPTHRGDSVPLHSAPHCKTQGGGEGGVSAGRARTPIARVPVLNICLLLPHPHPLRKPESRSRLEAGKGSGCG